MSVNIEHVLPCINKVIIIIIIIIIIFPFYFVWLSVRFPFPQNVMQLCQRWNIRIFAGMFIFMCMLPFKRIAGVSCCLYVTRFQKKKKCFRP